MYLTAAIEMRILHFGLFLVSAPRARSVAFELFLFLARKN